MKRMRLVALSLALAVLLGGCSAEPQAVAPEPAQEPLVVFLVRHGEKVDASEDPELSPAGDERAIALALALRDAEIDQIHSSDYIRTRDTAAPTAETLALEVQIYDPRDLPSLAERLLAARGRHLVVGHSNTTPAMTGLLGGEPGPEIDENGEFDRLYVVTVGSDDSVQTVLLRYGEPYDEQAAEAEPVDEGPQAQPASPESQ